MDDDWTSLVRAYRQYDDARRRLFRGDPVEVLRRQLAMVYPTPPDRDVALRVLVEWGATRPDVIAALVPELLGYAIGFEHRGLRFRQLLAGLDRDVLRAHLEPAIDDFLAADEPDRVAADYAGLIDFLDSVSLDIQRDEIVERLARAIEEEA